MAAWDGWTADVLRAIGAPITSANLRWLDTWHSYEQSSCHYNPLNTTFKLRGSANCNPTGVQSYTSASQGTQATKATLENGLYPTLLAALRSGDPYTYPLQSQMIAELRRWGSASFANWLSLAPGSGQQQPGSSSETSYIPGVNSRGLDAWHSLNHAVAAVLPSSLKRSRVLRQAAARNLARRLK